MKIKLSKIAPVALLSAVAANAGVLGDSAIAHISTAGSDVTTAGAAVIGVTAIVFAIGIIIFVVKRKG